MKKSHDAFTCSDTVCMCDRQTDGQTELWQPLPCKLSSTITQEMRFFFIYLRISCPFVINSLLAAMQTEPQ